MQPGFGNQPIPDATHHLPISRPHKHHRSKGDDLAMPRSSLRGKPRAQFLLDIPAYEYKLPKEMPINATIVDLIAVVPQWFRNPGITWRFMNNGINAAVHFAILEQHRHLGLTNAEEAERARDHISDTYRKTMRKMENFSGWTKAGHNIPDNWNKLNISVSGYLPESAKKIGYVTPASIPFIVLAVGLKKLPQGYDAGDLSRALQFAMQNQKLGEHGRPTEFMFPDDIQPILDHIGHTQNTDNHVDDTVVRHYYQVLRDADGTRRKQFLEQRRQQQAADEAVVNRAHQSQMHHAPLCQESLGGHGTHRSPLEATSRASSVQLHMQPAASVPALSSGHENIPPAGMGALMPAAFHDSPMTQDFLPNIAQSFMYDQTQDQGRGRTAMSGANYSSPCISHATRSNSQEAAANIASELLAQGAQKAYVDFPDIPDICKFETDDQKGPFVVENWSHLDPQRATEAVDALMAVHQTYDLNTSPNPIRYLPQARYRYHPSTILRNGPEELDLDDHSDLARALPCARQ